MRVQHPIRMTRLLMSRFKRKDVSWMFVLLCGCLFLISSALQSVSSSPSPISISLPLPLASVPQPVTIKQNPIGMNGAVGVNTNNNDVIGYIVVPYPGIDQRSDPLQQPMFSL